MTSAGWPYVATAPATTSSDVVIEPGAGLRGRIRVPGDKSVSHRALLVGALAHGVSVIRGLSDGDDVRRTALAVAAHGARVEHDDASGRAGMGLVRVHGGRRDLHEAEQPIDVGNSGTGIRLLCGWSAPFNWLTVLHGDRYIARRPMGRVVEPLRAMGARIDGRDDGRLPPLALRGGGLRGIDYRLPVASAQVKAAVLLAGLDADGTTTVHEPSPVRAHTEELLEACGAAVTVEDGGATVAVRRCDLSPLDLLVPGDPSQAAFWVVAGAAVPGSDVVIEGVYVGRARAGFLDVLGRMGADLELTRVDATTADIRVRSSELRATVVEGEEVAGLIDEIPALAVAAALARGTTEFRDAAELRVKETDRIATTTDALGALGVTTHAWPDGFSVSGGTQLRGATIRSQGDHRIAMAGAVAALMADGPTTVEGWDAVATSYPAFLSDLEQLRS